MLVRFKTTLRHSVTLLNYGRKGFFCNEHCSGFREIGSRKGHRTVRNNLKQTFYRYEWTHMQFSCAFPKLWLEWHSMERGWVCYSIFPLESHVFPFCVTFFWGKSGLSWFSPKDMVVKLLTVMSMIPTQTIQ